MYDSATCCPIGRPRTCSGDGSANRNRYVSCDSSVLDSSLSATFFVGFFASSVVFRRVRADPKTKSRRTIVSATAAATVRTNASTSMPSGSPSVRAVTFMMDGEGGGRVVVVAVARVVASSGALDGLSIDRVDVFERRISEIERVAGRVRAAGGFGRA
eukprot:31302-Pelagococcus_subviridis.AAC.6